VVVTDALGMPGCSAMKSKQNLLLPLVAAVAVVGCDGNSRVRGTVSYDGVPIADGAMTLLPADGQGPTAGGKIANGRYDIAQVTPGAKIVQIIGVKEVKFVASSAELEELSKRIDVKSRRTDVVFEADTVPEDAQGNYARIEVMPGDQTFDFELLPQPPE
jgi:hypothetical protein